MKWYQKEIPDVEGDSRGGLWRDIVDERRVRQASYQTKKFRIFMFRIISVRSDISVGIAN